MPPIDTTACAHCCRCCCPLCCSLLPRAHTADAALHRPAPLSPTPPSSDPIPTLSGNAVLLRTQESGLPVTLSCAYKVYLTIFHAASMSPEERITEAHM